MLQLVIVWMVLLLQQPVDVRCVVAANVGDEERDELRRHIVKGGVGRVDRVQALVVGQHGLRREEDVEGLGPRREERRQLIHASAHDDGHRVVLRGEGKKVAARARHKPAIGHDGVRSNNHLVHPRHHREDARIGDKRRVDARLGQLEGCEPALAAGSGLRHNHLEGALLMRRAEEALNGRVVPVRQDDLVRVDVLDGLLGDVRRRGLQLVEQLGDRLDHLPLDGLERPPRVVWLLGGVEHLDERWADRGRRHANLGGRASACALAVAVAYLDFSSGSALLPHDRQHTPHHVPDRQLVRLRRHEGRADALDQLDQAVHVLHAGVPDQLPHDLDSLLCHVEGSH
mmetsp:Transcript_39331/g.91993  ORF Transcript_39331/g.91993 Transcript_39331/m.91993 type:complete len:343 (+) Transcript_39331:341-1369(+)